MDKSTNRGRILNKSLSEQLEKFSSISDNEERLVLATGCYIGDGFDNACLDRLFRALPISWKGTLVQYTGRWTIEKFRIH